MEAEHPELCDWGDMDHDTLFKVMMQTPRGTVVQFHNNGEPLLYPYLGTALNIFGIRDCIRQFNTNGKLLMEKAEEIVDQLEVLTISVIENDPEGDEQYATVRKFLEYREAKGSNGSPQLVYRLLGKVDDRERWERLPGTVCNRVLHAPEGSRDYQRKVTVPETGICQDLLTHLAVDRFGNISMCVRFDPQGHLRIGNVKQTSLEQAWLGAKRVAYLGQHVKFNRKALPGCRDCDFYGVPVGQ